MQASPLFAGEAEDGLDELLTDAWHGRLAPVYNHMAQLPNLAGVPLPFLPQTGSADGGKSHDV